MLTAEIDIAGERLLLHPHRALYWPRLRWLVVSDLHLGKAAHLRKGGLALPEGQDERTIARLQELVGTYLPERIVFLGDVFHSSHNSAWDRFAAWCTDQRAALHLVPGNHDVLADKRYAEAGIQVTGDTLEEGPFVFAHEPAEQPGVYRLCGHLHPGVVLKGRGRQRMMLPCFVFSERLAILPAFGLSTGLLGMAPSASERVHAITERAVIDVSTMTAGHAVVQP